MAMEFTSENFQKEVLESELPVMVDFYANWCVPCKMMAPIVGELGSEYEGKVKVGKLDVDAAGDIAAKYGIMSIPTIIVFKGGQIVKKAVGAHSKKQLEEFMELAQK